MPRASTKPAYAVATVLLGVAVVRLLPEGLHALSGGSMARHSLAGAALRLMAIRGAGPAVGPDPHDRASRTIAREADLRARTQ